MNRTAIRLTILLCFLSQPVFAQSPSVEGASQSLSATACANAPYVVSQELSDALSATPPERAKYGRAFCASADRLHEIDAWIEHTEPDASANLIMRDILLAMPIQTSGPRLVALAKKSQDPVIQATWERHLNPYPGPFSSVLSAWIRQPNTPPQRLYELLSELGNYQPQSALKLWATLIENNPISKLDKVATYGLRRDGALEALNERLTAASADETSHLRLYRAILRTCEEKPDAVLSSSEVLERDLSQYLEHKAVSRRIVALNLIATLRLPAYLPQAHARYEKAKNTTEKAHAMRAIVLNAPTSDESVAIIDQALSEGDEIMRLTAATLLESAPEILSSLDETRLRHAFEKELWPETQLKLYRAFSAHSTDNRFKHDVLLNSALTASTRLAALEDLSATQETAAHLTLKDMGTLQRDEAPIDLIAATAEAIYDWHPDTRETLQQWLVVQRPFERRLLLTFSRFMRRDHLEADATMPTYIREICRHGAEDENTLMPCLSYLEDHATADEDKTILETLKKRKKQFDMMLDM